MAVIPLAQWTPQYCAVCDKQIACGSLYCSEKCRCEELLSVQGQEKDSEASSDSSDEDVDRLDLNTKQSSTESRKKPHFLYASPKLCPQRTPPQSPAVSPLIMPSVVSDEIHEHVSMQSINTYRRWLLERPGR